MVAVDTVPGTVNSCTGLLPPKEDDVKKKKNVTDLFKYTFSIIKKHRTILDALS